MIVTTVRKVGNSYVVTVPKEMMERDHLQEGQLVALELTPVEQRPMLSPELKAILDEAWEDLMPGLEYLADR
ncbi:MAG: AbrB/MazE/SpoVT family DNA-binding domain-containing protein [Chloroflexota bacterium]